MNENITKIPKHGFKVNLDHVYPENWVHGFIPRWKQIWLLIPLVIRYIIDYVKTIIMRRSIVMDYLKTVRAQQIYGVPLGGIGAGTIGRGYCGEFCRFQLKPGIYNYTTIEANEFIVTIKDSSDNTLFQSTLSTYKRSTEHLRSWKQLLDASSCKYTGLYPRAWTEYDLSDYGIKLTCRQVSPVIPHNYKDSSLPCAVFVWSIHNISNEKRKVTIAFTFKNGVGNKSDKKSSCNSKSFSYLDSSGVVLSSSIENMPCTYALGAKQKDNMNISKCLYFDPNSDGQEPWNQLYQNGCFEKSGNEADGVHNEMACGIAVQVEVSPSSIEEPEMCLVWDMPVVSFPYSDIKYTRFYAKYFGNENASLKIVNYALNNYHDWELLIYQWQQPILDDDELPGWYKSALFNETYFVSDGGTVWFTLSDKESEKLSVTDPRQKYGRFAYLEGHEYRMYNTYDVHFYASFVLTMNWPHLQQVLQYDFKDFIYMEIPVFRRMWFDGLVVERKRKNCVPHDVGDPNENPFQLINAYPVHDVSNWRDLNPKFVLQVLRDYQLTKDLQEPSFGKKYLEDMYEACHKVMHKSMSYDSDHDCLIENGGFPDQTFDTWIMSGASAYCGGLWLAALYAMIVFARELNKNADEKMYAAILEKAKSAYENKLWNGKYYNFDCSKYASTIMSDQFCGHWYIRASGFDYEVFPQSNIQSMLKTVFNNNVMNYKNGTAGAVNGYVLDKGVDESCIQSEEMWTGVTYALASCMLFEDLNAEAWKTIGGMIHTLHRIGLIFQTPEALGFKHYRSVGYMRPLSIWAVQLAWEKQKKKSLEKAYIHEDDHGESQT